MAGNRASARANESSGLTGLGCVGGMGLSCILGCVGGMGLACIPCCVGGMGLACMLGCVGGIGLCCVAGIGLGLSSWTLFDVGTGGEKYRVGAGLEGRPARNACFSAAPYASGS